MSLMYATGFSSLHNHILSYFVIPKHIEGDRADITTNPANHCF